MATCFRATLPDDDGVATVTAGVVTYAGGCTADEIAVIVGDSVPRSRCGSELRGFLKLWAESPKDPDSGVGAGNVKTYVAAPGVPAGQVAAATVLGTTAPTETQWGVVLGQNAAVYLDRSNVLRAAIERAFSRFVSSLGL